MSDEEVVSCPECERPVTLCVCAHVTPVENRTELLVLQHPQEPGMEIGTVPILARQFTRTVVKTGLSWPNLKKALGREVDPKRWGVLYMGSVHVEKLPVEGALFAVDKKGAVLQDQRKLLSALQGVVLIDGTWSQAKALWWRNAWLLKLQRLVLNAQMKSQYDRIRREPRAGCLSTLESAAVTLSVLERKPELVEHAAQPLARLVEAARALPRPVRSARKPDRRRRPFRRARS